MDKSLRTQKYHLFSKSDRFLDFKTLIFYASFSAFLFTRKVSFSY